MVVWANGVLRGSFTPKIYECCRMYAVTAVGVSHEPEHFYRLLYCCALQQLPGSQDYYDMHEIGLRERRQTLGTSTYVRRLKRIHILRVYTYEDPYISTYDTLYQVRYNTRRPRRALARRNSSSRRNIISAARYIFPGVYKFQEVLTL